MTHTNLRLTIFRVEKLKNIVGLGNVSSFQITTFFGDSLGVIGTVLDPSKYIAANDNFELEEPALETSWLSRRILQWRKEHK